jgi:hypothetical protein
MTNRGRFSSGKRHLNPRAGYIRQLQVRAVLVLAALLPLVALNGCVGVAGQGWNPAGGQAVIQATPATVNFGNVTVGTKSSQTVSVKNTGTADGSISGASLSSTQFSTSGITLPATLPAGQSLNFLVWFNGTTAGQTTATLTLKTSQAAGDVPIALQATAVAPQPVLTTNPASLSFGAVTVGTKSSLPVMLTNTGGSDLTISVLTLNGASFSVSGIATPKTIPAGQSATMNVTYAPSSAGNDSGSIVITSNDSKSPATLPLSGTGTTAPVAPTITTQPANKTVTAGQTATFTAVAAGTAPLSYQWQRNGVNVAGATSASYTTPATTTADSGSTFRVVVNNTAGTVTSATATLTVNAAPVAGIQASSTSINFGNAVVGSNLSQVLIITNTGTATLSITQVTESGSAFTASGFSLPLNVSAGQHTTITVAFLPTSVGSASGNISIVSNAPTSPTSVSLSGTGIAATYTLGISPASLSFGNVTTGTTSASQNVAITNTGNSNVTISQIGVSGAGFSATGVGAPVTLSPSQSVTLTVQFSPSAVGSASGTISVVSNASGSPATISVTGTGVIPPVAHSVALAWNASSSTVSGYNVYRSTVSGSSYAKVNSTLLSGLTYTDGTVQSAQTYYYVTTAVDSSGYESVYSNEVSATIP